MLRRTPSAFSATSRSVSIPWSRAMEYKLSPRCTAYRTTIDDSDLVVVVASASSSRTIIDVDALAPVLARVAAVENSRARDRGPSRDRIVLAREAPTTRADVAIDIATRTRRRAPTPCARE